MMDQIVKISPDSRKPVTQYNNWVYEPAEPPSCWLSTQQSAGRNSCSTNMCRSSITPQSGDSPVDSESSVAWQRLYGAGSWIATHITLARVLRFIILTIGTASFLTETSELAAIYYRYPTVVNVKIDRDLIVTLPSFTICIPIYLVRQDFRQMYHQFIEDSLKTVQSATLNPYGGSGSGLNLTGFDQQDLNGFPKLSEADRVYYMNRILSKYMSKSFDTPLELHNLLLFANDSSETKLLDYRAVINCKLVLPLLSGGPERGSDCDQVAPVIESIHNLAKCFTFFSQMNDHNTSQPLLKTSVDEGPEREESTSKFQVSLSQGLRASMGKIAAIDIHFSWMPEDNFTRNQLHAFWEDSPATIKIHPATELPTHAKSHKLRPGYDYDIYFSRVLSHLLPPPYETMCHSYKDHDCDQDGGQPPPYSRADCLDSCIVDLWQRMCNCSPSHISIRTDTGMTSRSSNGSEPRRPSICSIGQMRAECLAGERNSHCYEKCLPDCNQEEVDYEVEESIYPTGEDIRLAPTEWRSLLENKKSKMASINLIRKFSGDIIYSHTAQMPYVEFLSYVASLASMWLGISVLALYDQVIVLLRNVGTRLKKQSEQGVGVGGKMKNIQRRVSKRLISPLIGRRHNRVYPMRCPTSGRTSSSIHPVNYRRAMSMSNAYNLYGAHYYSVGYKDFQERSRIASLTPEVY